jgi:quercetin dioxygenase-like cupin family protein
MANRHRTQEIDSTLWFPDDAAQDEANTRIPEHYNPGRICVQILFGYIRMHADGKSFDLRRGQCLVLDRAVVHDVESVEESAFLLTVARSEVGGN